MLSSANLGFFLDTGSGNEEKYEKSPFGGLFKPSEALGNNSSAKLNVKESKAQDLDKFFEIFPSTSSEIDFFDKQSSSTKLGQTTKKKEAKSLSEAQLEAQKALKKAIVTPDFEKLKVIPPYEVSKKKLQQERKLEREKTKGNKWYGLPATEMTEEVKRDLEILQMRSVLDPKHFYKKNDLNVLPKYFQIGKVLDSPLDFYNNRLTNKERKNTLVDELLADAEFQKYNKRKYKEVIEEKQKTHYKEWRKAKKLKRKNKK